ncbi:MAG TPA: TetR/AcrR family transcriptional regulator [Solirubrobacterales bacterium]|jgi:AcrR family transcriptional regulator|nr:TetR/AcrR family transcriptional regulator [Solirubrobacterales bacterium]
MTTADALHQSVEMPLPRGPYAISVDAVAADQRRRMLEALPRAVAANGFEGTTVEHIVKLGQVRRNSFYEQFSDKRDCFTAAYEIAQERLLGVLTFQCYTRSGLSERMSAALGAGLGLLGANPSLARLIVIEAPAAGGEIALRHQQWLDRYSRLLQLAAVGSPDMVAPRPTLESAIVGAIVSRIKQLILADETSELPALNPELVELALSYYGSRALLEPLPTSPAAEVSESEQPQGRRSVLEPA